MLSDRTTRAKAHELAVVLAEAPFRADGVVVEMLRVLRRHVPLVLVTNATPELNRDLEAMGLVDLADDVVSISQVGVVKPGRLRRRSE